MKNSAIHHTWPTLRPLVRFREGFPNQRRPGTNRSCLRALASLRLSPFNRRMTSHRALGAILAFALFASIARADEASDKTALIQLERDLASALVKSDLAGLEEKLTADWKIVLSEGAIMTREELVQYMKSGKLKFSASSVDELDIRVYGDAAVVVGISISKGTWDGQAFDGRDRFSDIFIRKDGKWRCVSSHNSTLKNG